MQLESQFRRMPFLRQHLQKYLRSLSKYVYFLLTKIFFNGKIHKVLKENICGQALRYYVIFFVSS